MRYRNKENRPLHKERTHTRWRIFIMYCMLIVVVLLSLLPVYHQVVSTSHEKNYSSYNALMQTGLSLAEDEIFHTLELIYELKNNESLKKIAIFDDEANMERFSLSYNTFRTLTNMVHQKNVVRDIEVYFSKNNLHFTTSRLFTSLEEYYGTFFALDGVSMEAYRAMQKNALRSSKIFYYPAQSGMLFDDGEVNLLMCYAPFYLSGQLSRTCGAYFLIDTARLRMAADAQDLGGVYIITNVEGQILYMDGCTEEEAQYLVGMKGQQSVPFQNGRYDLYTFSGQNLGLRHYWCVSTDRYPIKPSVTLGMIALCICFAAILGMILAAYMTRVQYAPIRHLQDVVGDEVEPQEGNDEYAAFANAYLAVRKNNHLYQERIQELNSVLEANVFEKVLWRVGDVEEASDWLEQHTLHALLPQFRLVEVYVFPLFPIEPMEDATDVAIISAMLSDQLPKYWDSETFVHPISRDHLVFLIPAIDEDRRVIRDKLSNLRQYICRAFDVDMTFGVSQPYTQIQEIHSAFMQTQNIMQKRAETSDVLLQEEGAVLFAEEPRKQRTGTQFNQYTLEHLCNFIVTGNAEAAHNLISGLANGCSPDFESRAQLFYSIRQTLEFKFNELDSIHKAGETLELPSFSGSMITNAAFDALDDCCASLCSMYAKAFPNGTLPAKERILEYIEENYADPDLYGKQIASKFDLSEKYLYTYFKKQMGVGFSDYLEDLRLHRAIELLSSSRMSISEIAAKVGFNSHNTFYKAFKRKYGITPSEYRNANSYVRSDSIENGAGKDLTIST